MKLCEVANDLSSAAFDLLTRLMEFRAAGEPLTPRNALDAIRCVRAFKGVID